MLSGETARGEFPLDAVKTMSQTAFETQRQMEEDKGYFDTKLELIQKKQKPVSNFSVDKQVGNNFSVDKHSSRNKWRPHCTNPVLLLIIP